MRCRTKVLLRLKERSTGRARTGAAGTAVDPGQGCVVQVDHEAVAPPSIGRTSLLVRSGSGSAEMPRERRVLRRRRHPARPGPNPRLRGMRSSNTAGRPGDRSSALGRTEQTRSRGRPAPGPRARRSRERACGHPRERGPRRGHSAFMQRGMATASRPKRGAAFRATQRGGAGARMSRTPSSAPGTVKRRDAPASANTTSAGSSAASCAATSIA